MIKLSTILKEIKPQIKKISLDELKKIIESKLGLYVMKGVSGSKNGSNEPFLIVKRHSYAIPKVAIFESEFGWDLTTNSGEGSFDRIDKILFFLQKKVKEELKSY